MVRSNSKKVRDAKLRKAAIASASRRVVNKQFNRLELPASHLYFTDHGKSSIGKSVFAAKLKCALFHRNYGSTIVPQMLFVGPTFESFIQPQGFLPSSLYFFDSPSESCPEDAMTILVDISCGETVAVRTQSKNYVGRSSDGSHIFEVEIEGPPDLFSHITGEAEWSGPSEPNLLLYHHTKKEFKDMILKERHIRASSWNIRGNTTLKNYSAVYFTPMNIIKFDSDLIQIAMVGEQDIFLVKDGFDKPSILFTDHLPDHVVKPEVYRSSTRDRDASIKFSVPASMLAHQHIYFHTNELTGYYKISHPFIHRAVTLPGSGLHFNGPDHTGTCIIDRAANQAALKDLEYIVCGDASTREGLLAPFDETGVGETMKIETSHENPIAFWKKNQNSDQYTLKTPELLEANTTRGN